MGTTVESVEYVAAPHPGPLPIVKDDRERGQRHATASTAVILYPASGYSQCTGFTPATGMRNVAISVPSRQPR